MEKITFEDGTLVTGAYVTINGVDYPVQMPVYSGSTPLSAETLNQLQENVEDAIKEKNIITISAYRINVTTSTPYEQVTIPMTIRSSTGDKLTVSNNKIKIGSEVSKVKVGGYACFRADKDVERYLTIRKNGGEFDNAVISQHTANQFTTHSIPSGLINVTLNDEIDLGIAFSLSNVTAYIVYSQLTVEVVE